jgi:putative ABC transport system permease protein
MSVGLSVRHAWRSLGRTPVFTVTAALTLVIGIGAAVAMFAVVNGVLLRPLPYGNPDQLVGAWHDLPPLNMTHAQQTQATYFTYKRLARSIEGIGVYQDGAVNVAPVRAGAEPQRVTSAWITADLIPILQVSPMRGRTFTAAEDLPNGPSVVIIGEALWRNQFGGDPAVIGKKLDVGGLSREIVGVMPQSFRFPERETQLWLPLQLDPNAEFTGGFNYNSIARLKPGITVEAAQRDFVSVLPRVVEISPNMAPGVPFKMVLEQAKPQPVLIPLRQDITGNISRTLWIVAGAAALVLLVACANVTNLILVRADGRQRELAVREALGAGRARVMLHFLGESAVLASLAAIIGLGVAALAIRALVTAGPTEIPRLTEVRIDLDAVAFTVVITALVTLVCSIIPALRIGRVHLSNALREGGRSGTAGRAQHRIRGALVAAQMALALVVLAGSGLLMRTFQRLHAIEPGFDARNVATFWMSLPQARYATDTTVAQFYARLLDKVRGLPGVKEVGVSSRLPLTNFGMNQNPFYVENDPSAVDKIPHLQIFTTVDAGYFRAMGIPLLAGRTFDPLETQRDKEAIISQATAVQFFQDSTGRAAIGKRFRELPGAPWYTVIGVVGNARDTALAAPPSQTVYFPEVPRTDKGFSQTARTMALVVKTTGEPAAITSSIRRAIAELDPSLPTFSVRPLAEVLRASTAQLSFIILMLGAAAAVTLTLGAIGLYGVMAYVVTLRTRELGVRIALGAQPSSVAAMLTRQGLMLTLLGVGGGLVLFALVARFMRALLYGTAPSDPVAIGVAAIALVVVAAFASWIPARRAARLDPADALRAE